MSLELVDHHERSDADGHEKASDTLLSLAAHDLRTPLSVIKWYTEMLLDGDCGTLNDDQTKYLKTIQSSNERAIDLIRSLLNVSRLTLGTFSISPVEADLSRIVKQVLSELSSFITEKKITIEESYVSDSSPLVPTLLLDKQMCVVILRNLISNAILFSKEEGKVLVSIHEVKQGDECGGEKILEDSLLFSVTDSGIGIPEKDKEKIFSKLYKGSNVAGEESKGAGLGLYMTELIVSNVGGAVWFTSTENVGSTFYVTFPKQGMQKKEGTPTLD